MPRLIAAGGLSTELHSGKVTLGEGPGVDVALPPGLGIAAVHAELRPLLGGYVIKHLGGDAHHTLVNDKPITSLANLSCGDNIRLGALPFTLVLKEDPEPAPDEDAPHLPPPAAANAAIPTAAPAEASPAEEAPSLPFPRLSKPSLVQAPAPQETPALPAIEAPIVPALPATEGPPALTPPPTTPSPTQPVEIPPAVNELPPLPPNLAEAAPSPGNTELPPLPPNLAEAAPSPGNTELPPLPPNLAEAAPSPGNAELPPLPPNLAEAAPSPGNDALPPVPAFPAAAPGISELPPELPLVNAAPQEPHYSEAPPITPPEAKPWDDSQPISSDPEQNVTVKLAPPERPAERARRKSPLIEFAVPGIITLLVIAGGIVFLQQHNKKLEHHVEGDASPLETGTTTSEPKPSTPVVAESKFTKALEKLTRERKRPRHHEFPAENFIFNVPGKEWLLSSSNEVPEAQVMLEHASDNSKFVVIGEALGQDGSYTEKDLLEVVKSNMLAFTPHLQFINKGKLESKGMTFNRFDARARMDDTKRYLVNISMFHQGFFYQLITYGEGDGDHEAPIQKKAVAMLRHFDLIDRQRVLALNENYEIDSFSAPTYGYSVSLNKHFWEPWPLREFEFPGAHMAAQSAQGSIFGVMPMQFSGEVPDLEDLTTAFLGTLGIRYPAEDLEVEEVAMARGKGRQVIARQVQGHERLHYQLQVIKRGNFAYLAGGWSPAINRIAVREIPKALTKVVYREPSSSGKPAALSYGQRRAQSALLHQLGTLKLYQEELDLALNYFKSAVDTHPAYYEVYTQLVSTFTSIGRTAEGIAFFQDLVEKRDDVKAKAALALMHCQAGQVDEGKRQYEALFAQDFHDQEHFLGFVNALASERRYDEALELIRTVGEKESSFLQALFEGLILNDKGDYEASLAILQTLQQELNSDPMVAKELVRALVGLKREKDAFALADSESLKDDPGLAEYIRGVCHDQLEAYEDAKACYAKAARLEPMNRQYQRALATTSSIMGQGDSSMVKVEVDAVPMPSVIEEAVRDLKVDSTTGVHDVYQVSVADYRKGRPFKTTEYRKVKALDQTAVRTLNTLQYSFHPTADQIYVNYLRVKDSSGKLVAEGDINETFITDVPVTEIASDGKILHVPVPGLAPGYELEVAVTRQRQGTASNFGFHREIFAGHDPNTYRAFAVTGDTAALDYHTTSDIALLEQKDLLFWSAKNIPQLAHEAYQAPLKDFVPILYVSESSRDSWQSLGDDYLHSLHARLTVDEATRSTARRETASANSPREKVEALARYVQKSITYKGIEFGQRALMPNKSSQIIQNRYGDCKDHSLLLHQLLRSVGVPSHLVLIHSRLSLIERFPSIGQFNHMILAVPLDGKLEYIDCTNKYAPIIGNSAESMAGRRCLVLQESASKLGTIPSEGIERRIAIHHAITVNANGSLSCQDTATFTGSSGTIYRATFASMTPAQRENTLDRMLRVSRRFQMKSVEFGNLDDPSQPFTLTLGYDITGAFVSSDAGYHGTLAWPLEVMLLASDDSTTGQRQSPIHFIANQQLEGTVTLTLPTGTSIEPNSMTGQTHAGEIFSYETSQAGSHALTYRCLTSSGKHPAAAYPAFQADQESFLNLLETKLTLSPATLAADSERE